MAGVPGQLLSQEFVDFSTTRKLGPAGCALEPEITQPSHRSIPSVLHHRLSMTQHLPSDHRGGVWCSSQSLPCR